MSPINWKFGTRMNNNTHGNLELVVVFPPTHLLHWVSGLNSNKLTRRVMHIASADVTYLSRAITQRALPWTF
jgi:hypothetical protein